MFGRKKQTKEPEVALRDKTIMYKRFFASNDGREILYDLMDRNFIIESHKGDAFSEGRRAAILDIIHFCKVDLKLFDELLKEGEE